MNGNNMASALENYVNNVRTLSAAGSFRELADHLNDTVELLAKNWNFLDNVLETLDAQLHSLGYLYVLIAKFTNAANACADADLLIQHFKNFINLCNSEQMRFATHAYYELCHLFTNFIVNQPNCIQGIKVLAQAIEKIRLFDSQLTAIHADLCLISLKAKCLHVAIRFLDIDITSISTATDTRTQNGGTTSFHISAQDANNDAKYFLLYYYYGGMIYTGMKNFDRALYFYEVCISTPAMTMSHIMLEAYKKYILVSLILHGKVMQIPKYSSQVVTRFMKPLTQSYHELASTYASSSSNELRAVINKNSEIYTRDLNMGLVKQVANSLYKKNIQRLTKTFLTLSLEDVARRVQLSGAEEAEKYIFDMIRAGEMFAKINQKDGMVVFTENPEKYNSPEMFLKVQDNMTNAMELIKQINKMEEEIVLNPMYVKKAFGNHEEELQAGQHTKSYSIDPTE